MDAKVIERQEMSFLGVEEVFASVDDHDADLVMFKRFMPNAAVFDKYAIDQALYALNKNMADGSCSYMVGKRVATMSEMPKGLPDGSVYKTIPSSSYVEIKTTPRELGAVEQGKAKVWFEEHPEYTLHPDSVGVEYYPAECNGADGTMWTWYPIVHGK